MLNFIKNYVRAIKESKYISLNRFYKCIKDYCEMRVVLYFLLIFLLYGCTTSNQLKRVESKIDFLMRRERGKYIWVDGKGWKDTCSSYKPYLELWKIELATEKENKEFKKKLKKTRRIKDDFERIKKLGEIMP